MHNSKIKQITLAVWLAMVPFAADAAGLGKLTVISGLGEPLNAEIELVSATKEELSSLTAKIASPEVYEQQGIERPAGLVGIKVDLGKQADGTPVLKISSPSPMNDPYLDMLIQVDWGTGRLMRQYTALLDPPGYNNDQSSNSASTVAKTNRPSVSSSSAGTSSASSGKASKRSKKVKPQADQAPATETSSEKPSESSAQGDYTTKRGDTLRAVASQMHVEGVSLEQMLVGIYQANKSAFAGDNMNRLKVGQVLRAPTQDELQGISKQDAQKEIQVQTQDWNAYRHKLAEGVAEAAPARDEESAQSASGKVTTSAQEKGVKPDAAPKDVVKLSKNDVAGKPTAKGDSKAAEAASSEDKIAKEKADKEANARVTELEKQIQDMQKLLEVKNKAIADQQAKAATPAEVVKPAEVAKPVEASKPVEAAKPVEAPKVEVPKTVEAPKPTVKPKPAYVPPPAPEPSLVDDILQDPIKLGGVGAGLIALLGGGFLLMRNKRRKSLDSFEQGILTTGGLKPNTVFGNTAGGTVDTGDSSFLADFTQGSSVGMIDTNDVDPVAEAEVYMAYGRDAQAEEILKDALLKEPKRYELHHKLLEIYSNRKDTAAFETLAGEMYSALDSSDPVWQKVAEMGRKLEPENPLYAEQSGGISVPVASAVDVLSETKLNEEESFPSIAAADEDTSMDLGFSGVQDEGEATLDFSIDTLSGVQSSELTGNDAPAVDDNSLDFDLGGFDATPEAPLTTESAERDVPDFESSLNPLADVAELAPAISDDNSLDINFDTPELVADEPVTASEVEDLGFDLDIGGDLAETPPALAAQEKDDLVLDDLDSFNMDSTIVTDTEKLSEPDTPVLLDEPRSVAEQEEEISFDLPDMVPVPAATEEAISLDIPEDEASVAMDLELPDFELGENVVESLDETMIMNTPPKMAVPEESLVMDDAGTEALDLNFDVDLDDTPAVIEETSAAVTEVPDLDLSGISLDLADTELSTEFPVTDDEPEEIVLSDVESPDVDTKLDLVTAYIDMGDTEGARELLDEVLKEGGAQQRERAQSILATLT